MDNYKSSINMQVTYFKNTEKEVNGKNLPSFLVEKWEKFALSGKAINID